MSAVEVKPMVSRRPPFWAPGLGPLEVAGEIVLFGTRVFAAIPRALRYPGEIWWYAAFLAVSSTPVVLVMTYFTGSECSVEAYYSLHQLGGAESLAGVFNALCDTREITPLFFGFAIGAKVGCGLVAELGTMRVNEEIDALEVMGIPSKIYLVSTRMLSCFIVLPFMYLLSLGISYVGSYVVQMYQVPSGTIGTGAPAAPRGAAAAGPASAGGRASPATGVAVGVHLGQGSGHRAGRGAQVLRRAQGARRRHLSHPARRDLGAHGAVGHGQ